MLRSLAVRDFTIIDDLELEFGPGFGAITGETGAGKSILIDALAQLLGDRGDSSLVAQGRKRADLTATFELDAAHPAREWLRAQEIEDEPSLLLRRRIPADGSSRAWINGQPVAIAQLRELGNLLVEIHGQHQHQRLARASAQRALLDRHGDPGIVDSVRTAAGRHARLADELSALETHAGNPSELELIRFQLDELRKLGLSAGEFESLEQEQQRLGSVDELKLAIEQALESLEGESGAAASSVQSASRQLSRMTGREPALSDGLEMLTTAAAHIEETARLLKRLTDGLEPDPERLSRVEERLARSLDLARKHRIQPTDLWSLTNDLERKLQDGDQYEARRSDLTDAMLAAEQHWREQAKHLSRQRSEVARQLARDAEKAMAELGMTGARTEIVVEHDAKADVSPHGADRVETLFSANAGQSLRPLSRVASGGELSRFSLALIIAGAEDAGDRVRIFDEIDAGVGGETAHSVGRFLRQAASGGQALCVTHLAQVAAAAERQWRVHKLQKDGSTSVTIESLDREARIVELARMLGSSTGKTSRDHAAALLESDCSDEP